ncbi:MAG: Riboflavin synthase [Magnetococcales bacterium]|nr:Riboflavin synthase [Magnetococcales bacterium]HIJ84368.1 riboflavin synthase [Magnetococcales bacterium]
MFTGLIEGMGHVRSLQKGGADWSLGVTAPFDLAGVALGDSVAVNGVCLTVVARDAVAFTVQVSRETVNVTTMAGIRVGQTVNLERAMVLGGRLDGHLVQGHVDTVGQVERLVPRGPSTAIWFRVPAAFGRYIIPKGSIAVDGVSLTVNEVVDAGAVTRFTVNIIPHTGHKTTLSALVAGGLVNVETDLLGRYVERLLTTGGWGRPSGLLDEAGLLKKGFQ